MVAKLYYTPTSCGAASFISAHTIGVPLQCETVDLATHKTASGTDFYKINPNGATRATTTLFRAPNPSEEEPDGHTQVMYQRWFSTMAFV